MLHRNLKGRAIQKQYQKIRPARYLKKTENLVEVLQVRRQSRLQQSHSRSPVPLVVASVCLRTCVLCNS